MTTTNPTSTLIDILGSFPMGDRTCEVLCVHHYHQDMVHGLSYNRLLFRGQQDQASMTRADYDYFRLHRAEIPLCFAEKWFVFPDTVHNYSRVRCVRRSQSHEYWEKDTVLYSRKFGPKFVLVRFV